MPNSLETLENAPRTLITVGVRSALLPANDAVVAAAHSSGSVTRVLELEPAPEPPVAPHCLWCHRTFTRQGFGAAADHVRIDSLWRLREQGLYFAGKRSKVQEYLLWRRVAGGLEGATSGADPRTRAR